MRERRPSDTTSKKEPHVFTEEELKLSTAGIATSGIRGTMRQHWRENDQTRVHWMNREEVIASEAALAKQVLGVTGYQPGLVQQSRPFKNRPAETEDGSWRRPSPATLLAMEAEKSKAEHMRDPVIARVRAQRWTASDPANYFGGR